MTIPTLTQAADTSAQTPLWVVEATEFTLLIMAEKVI